MNKLLLLTILCIFINLINAHAFCEPTAHNRDIFQFGCKGTLSYGQVDCWEFSFTGEINSYLITENNHGWASLSGRFTDTVRVKFKSHNVGSHAVHTNFDVEVNGTITGERHAC